MALTITLTLSRGSQSITGNYTNVSWSLTYSKSSTTYNNNGVSYYVNIAGTRVKTGTVKFPKGTTSGTIATGSRAIYHNADGTHGAITGYAYVGPTGFSPSSASDTSNSISFPTIPRVSDLSVNKTSVPADGATTVTATATKKSSSFTDTIVVKLGSYSQTVTSGTAFTIPEEWINAISGTSATATVTVTTKSGSTTVGSKSVNLTITVPESIRPALSDISVSEAITSVTSAFGNRYVKTLSRLNTEVTAEGIYGSSITTYSTSIDGITYPGQSFQSNALNTAGTLQIKSTVTDSRNRTGELTKNVTVVDYFSPTITGMTYIPCDSDGTENSNGDYIKVIISGKVASVDDQNTRNLILKYKKSSDPAYTTKTITLSSYVFENVSTLISDIDPTSTYELIAELSDKISTTSYSTSTGVPVISRLAGGKGLRLFGEASEEGFWVGNIDMTISDEEYEELESLLGGVVHRLIDWIYPIGAVIASVNPDYDPNKLFKTHTWERFARGQKLVGVDESDTDFSAAGKVGGEKTHKLTESEMPSHNGHLTPMAGTSNGKYLPTASMSTYGSSARGWYSTSPGEWYPSHKANGSSAAHNNLQPYVAVYYWKRIL